MADTAVLAKARRVLASGPLSDADLVAQVLGVSGAPERVAARLARAMLGDHAEFERDATGWRFRAGSAGNPAAHDRAGDYPRHAERPVVRTRRASQQAAQRLDSEEADADGQMGLPGLAEHDPFRLDRMRFAVVDVETTGGSARYGDRITEIAVVPVDNGKVGEHYETLINPGRPIPRLITALTGISTAMVQQAPRFEDVAGDVLRYLEGRIFVAHNAAFDWRFVNDEVTRSLGRRLTGDRLCTVKLTRMLLPSLRRRNLDSISYYFGVENTARHRAGGDALATAHVLTHLLNKAQDEGIQRWPELIARVSRRTGQARRVKRGMPSWVQIDPVLYDPLSPT